MAGLIDLLERFAQAAPVAVMARASLEHIFANELLDRIFEDHARKQYTRELAFSSAFWLMVDVVTKSKPSLNSAYKSNKPELSVSVQSVYNKVNHTEMAVLEQLLGATAKRISQVIGYWKTPEPELIPGFSSRIIDGNVLAGSEHRIKELRSTRAAALPGRSVCFYNYESRLIDDIILDANAHAQDRSQIDAILTRVGPNEVIIGDSGLCTQKMMTGISSRKAYFILRKPANTALTRLGSPRKVGTGDTGDIYEQQAILRCEDKTELRLRVITIKRFKPTSNGKMEIELLTNLPSKVKATRIATAYRKRWSIENVFQDLGEALATEIDTLGYPGAALFGFTIGCILQNIHSMIEHSLRITHKSTLPPTARLSRYKLALEIQSTVPGMEIAIQASSWEKSFGRLSIKEFAKWLLATAKGTVVENYRTYRWSPKGPKQKRMSGKRIHHIATQKVLDKRENTT